MLNLRSFKLVRGLVLVLVILLAANSWAQEKRFALVIGNASYGSLGSLKNPLNDAKDMAASLKRLGFDVELVLDGQLSDMEEAVLRFRDRLATDSKSMGLFFYAGHGVQAKDGTNYLIPCQANISDEVFLKTKALSAQTVLELMQSAQNKLNLVFLDACRDNPFAWSRGGKRGLSMVANQPAGSIVVYATSAGSTAADGSGKNGVFTGELLKNLETPGVDLDTVLNRTAQGVITATKNEQNPAIYKQFFGTTYLKGQATPPPAQTDVSANNDSQGDEAVFGAVSMGSGKLEINVNAPATVSLLGKSVNVPAGGTLPVNKVKAGEITISIDWGDGLTDTRTAIIEADKTTSLRLLKPAGASNSSPAATETSLENPQKKPDPTVPVPIKGKNFSNSLGMDFIYIEGETFQMGYEGVALPVHRASPKSLWMSATEITQANWQQLMSGNPSKFKGELRPVEKISWLDAIKFCNILSQKEGLGNAYLISEGKVTWDKKSLGYRLPTEMEWEFAARGGSQSASRDIPALTKENALDLAWFSANSYEVGSKNPNYGTHVVASKKANILSLYDMKGNVWEWCWDIFAPYPEYPPGDYSGPENGSSRVIRGGGWNSETSSLHSAYRTSYSPEFGDSNIGFRVVRSLPSNGW